MASSPLNSRWFAKWHDLQDIRPEVLDLRSISRSLFCPSGKYGNGNSFSPVFVKNIAITLVEHKLKCLANPHAPCPGVLAPSHVGTKIDVVGLAYLEPYSAPAPGQHVVDPEKLAAAW